MSDNIEYEATFYPINRDEMRKKLRSLDAKLVKNDFMQTRVCYAVPESCLWDDAWLRIRDEDDQITLTLKATPTADTIQKNKRSSITDQKEVELVVDSFAKAETFLDTLGFRRKSYQESRREKWEMDGVEIVIDQWPWLEPYVEIEGENELVVNAMCEKLGFDWGEALFGGVDLVYQKKYNISSDIINNHAEFLFDSANPFN